MLLAQHLAPAAEHQECSVGDSVPHAVSHMQVVSDPQNVSWQTMPCELMRLL